MGDSYAAIAEHMDAVGPSLLSLAVIVERGIALNVYFALSASEGDALPIVVVVVLVAAESHLGLLVNIPQPGHTARRKGINYDFARGAFCPEAGVAQPG